MVSRIPSEGGNLNPKAWGGPDYEIDPQTGCWLWQRQINRTGYGTGTFKSAGIATQYAHRAYYMAAHGLAELDEDRVIDHLCRTPRCVNPAHLDLVPHHINSKRGDTAKLTEAQADEIRERLKTPEGMASIAKDYGVDEDTVWTIASGIAWREDYAAEPIPIRPEVYCLQCGGLITTGRRHKVYCCKRCRLRANSRRQWERKRAA